jgi:hypothetical protein
MTELLERAIAKLKTLSASEQDAIASMILEELQDDLKWDRAFANSPDVLAKLAASAMAEYAELRPISSTKQLRPFGLCAGEFTVPDDFDAPLPEDILSAFEDK